MKYKHARLFKQMMEQGVPQSNILSYFQGEGYSEAEILGELTNYEQQQAVSSALKEPVQEFSMEATRELPKREEPLPVKILMVFLVILILSLLVVGLVLLL